MTGRPITYSFGPVERRGILGSLGAGQAALGAAGAVAAVAALDLIPSAAGLLLGLVLLAACLLAALVRLGGRSGPAWAAIALAWLLRSGRARQARRRISPVVGPFTITEGPRSRGTWRAPPPSPPAALRGTRIISGEYRGRAIGALSEAAGRRMTAVLACRADAFALLDADAQARRLGRWGMVLAAAAGTPIRRLAWIERTAPDPGDTLAHWLHSERDPVIPLRGAPMIDSYLELISGGARVVQEHEILLAVQIDGPRAIRGATASALQNLLEHTERVAHGIEAAEVTVLGMLGPGQIARVLRTAFDPFARAELAAFDAADPTRDGLPERAAWPIACRESWDRLQSDGTCHATFWVSSWPRVEVSPMFLGPLLGRAGTVRTMAVTFEPIPPSRSTRDVEAAVTRDLADRRVRARFGQAETARQRQLAGVTRRREAELAAGHAEVRLSGYVTVSAPDPAQLRRACADVVEHAARARLELHRLYGHQAEAFTFTLPLCRGLR